MTLFRDRHPEIPDATSALPGRQTAIALTGTHFVNDRPLTADPPKHCQSVCFGMGCFWGAERLFWQIEGVWITSVGYAGGTTENPTYQEVCSGRTGHSEVVRVVFEPSRIGFDALLKVFWEHHDPTQGMGQGNDRGSQYRSAIYTTGKTQMEAALASYATYALRLAAAGRGRITTEIAPAGAYYHAEDYHQQYLAKNPDGYCAIGGTGVTCPIAPAS